MKILLVNKFFFLKGGAETIFFDTARLLEKQGHRVVFFSMAHERNECSEYEKYFVSKVDYDKTGFRNALSCSGRLLYSFEARKKIEALIAAEKPDIAHLHNIYHQISPSILHSLRKFHIPVVMTLHDYKISCAQYLMMAQGRPCEACINNTYYHCFLKNCIGGSHLRSLLNTIEMVVHHKILRIYDTIDCFISPSTFLKAEVEKMGFRGKNIMVLPNVLRIEDYSPAYSTPQGSILYFGRLSKEKGLLTLLEAAKGLKKIRFKIIGEGPLQPALEAKIREEKIDNVSLPGYKTAEVLKNEIRESSFVILPSEWYENNPRSLIEAFALAKPVIGARIGGIPELVIDGKTGLTFEPGNAPDLRSKIQDLLDHPVKIEEMGRNARAFVEQELSIQKYYKKLMEIYELAKKSKGAK